MKYKFEYDSGRFYAFYRKYWWRRWRPLTYDIFRPSLYQKNNGRQMTFKNYKEIMNGLLLEPDRYPKMIIEI